MSMEESLFQLWFLASQGESQMTEVTRKAREVFGDLRSLSRTERLRIARPIVAEWLAREDARLAGAVLRPPSI